MVKILEFIYLLIHDNKDIQILCYLNLLFNNSIICKCSFRSTKIQMEFLILDLNSISRYDKSFNPLNLINLIKIYKN